MKATVEVLYGDGLSFTIEEVSRVSGVAKTTIYRLWPSRLQLVLDACARFTPDPPVPDTGSFSSDIRRYVEDLVKALGTATWTGVLPAIVDAAERNADVAQVFAVIQAGHATPIREMVARAQQRKEVSFKLDPSVVAAMLIGPLFYRRWFSRESLTNEFVNELVRHIDGFIIGSGL